MEIIEPKSDEEWEKYMECRWEILRKPWNQPRGSEKLEDDDQSFHAMMVDESIVIGTIRLSQINDAVFQIRSMAVRDAFQNKGIGKLLIHYMENLTKAKRGNKVMLHARENAVEFYKNSGYKVVKKSYLLFDEIQHWQMEKELD